MPVVVVATVVPLPGQKDAVLAAFREAVAEVHAEPGCILYALTENEDRLVVVEQWESAEALAVHAGAEALQKLTPAIADKITGPPDVVVLNPVPAGDPDKGVVRP